MLSAVNLWEKITRSLGTFRLDTMRGKFVAFAVLATLFTTLVMTLMLYGRNRRSLSDRIGQELRDRKSTRLNSSHGYISYAVFCLKKKKIKEQTTACVNIYEKEAKHELTCHTTSR